MISILGLVRMAEQYHAGFSELFDHECVARNFTADKRQITICLFVSLDSS
jgi:hypothetical protein